jgi:hypothetical protein
LIIYLLATAEIHATFYEIPQSLELWKQTQINPNYSDCYLLYNIFVKGLENDETRINPSRRR